MKNGFTLRAIIKEEISTVLQENDVPSGALPANFDPSKPFVEFTDVHTDEPVHTDCYEPIPTKFLNSEEYGDKYPNIDDPAYEDFERTFDKKAKGWFRGVQSSAYSITTGYEILIAADSKGILYLVAARIQ